MALYTTVATGNWHADAATVWDLGAEPGPTDTFLINHDVTKDDDKAGTADAASGTIASGKTLAIGASGTLKTTGAITVTGTLAVGGRSVDMGAPAGTGSITATGGATFNIVTDGSTNSIQWTLEGSSGSLITIDTNGKLLRIYGSRYSTPHVQTLRWVDMHGSDLTYNGWLESFGQQDIVEDCAFYNAGFPLVSYAAGSCLILRRCFIYGGLSYGIYNQGSRVFLYDCQIGKTRAGGTDSNAAQDLYFENAVSDERYEAHNCIFTGTNLFTAANAPKDAIFRSQAHQQVIGAWFQYHYAGTVQRSTAAKKTGDYGIEFTPNSYAGAHTIHCDIPIPVATGDTVAPSIYYQNVTADLDLEAAAGRLVFELDPGDEWGLNEIIDVNGAADSYTNWRQVTFTGGTAGGTAAKGTVILRVTLARYVASGVVYLADLDPGVS